MFTFAALFVLSAVASASDALARTCDVELRLDEAVALGALGIDIGYANASGAFAYAGRNVSCTSAVPNALALFEDHEESRVIGASFIGSFISWHSSLARRRFCTSSSAA